MKKIFFVLAAVLAVCACKPELVIVHTNDTHSHLEPLRGTEDGIAGVVERAALMDSIRNASGDENVLLLHAGDFDQGSSYFTMFDGMLEAKLINALEYDAVILGNHEFDSGIESLTERVKVISCPVLCANIDFSSLELDKYIKPCVVIEKAGKKIGIVGIAPPLENNVAAPIASRVSALDPVESCNKWAEYLRKEQKCDLVIALTHIGYDEDQTLAAASRNLDFIIGGHSHTFVDEMIYVKDLDGKEVGIVTDGSWGRNLGVLKVR